MSETLEGLKARLALLERLVLCRQCEGTGWREHHSLGNVPCPYCDNTGISSRILNGDTP